MANHVSLQYNELAKLCGSGAVTTPPLSLSSSPARPGQETEQSVVDILERIDISGSKDAANKIREANKAVKSLQRTPTGSGETGDGVRIWSGPSADRPEPAAKKMPSISESPLEQDFTIEGKPSKLGCPFASMANKKLSSHAASVLGRYNHGSNGAAPSTPLSSVSRINGNESFSKKGDRRSSFVDPIKAEICGLSDHDEESPYSERAMKEHHEKQDNTDVGVCPIRFLDQHSPEEVATYFERHKHELPRSHEICVKRYQSNEQQIRELDAKYGTLVSMIQGLGAKHKDLLPKEPEDGPANPAEDGKDDEKVRKWASSVSAQAADGREALEGDEDRQPHFERPLRDIRVGESPSRPWGIPVPSKYLEGIDSQTSRKPGQLAASPAAAPDIKPENEEGNAEPAKCPFGFAKNETSNQERADDHRPDTKAKPAFITADANIFHNRIFTGAAGADSNEATRIVFAGPVFIGYSAEDAARILQNSGLGAK